MNTKINFHPAACGGVTTLKAREQAFSKGVAIGLECDGARASIASSPHVEGNTVSTKPIQIPAAPAERRTRRSFKVSRHRLQTCVVTGLARYRDRHQARAGAQALTAGANTLEVSTFACPDCRGFHVEKANRREPIVTCEVSDPTAIFTSSLATRKRRFFIVDIECLTHGAKATPAEVAKLWAILRTEAPGITPRDRVLVGAARRVARRYKPAINAPNIRWVVAADVKDGADRALLTAFDLWNTARNFDELVICSGDGNAFTELAVRAKRAGLSVQVVTTQSPRGGRPLLSRKLGGAADTHTLVRLRARTPIPTPTAKAATHILKHLADLQPAAA